MAGLYKYHSKSYIYSQFFHEYVIIIEVDEKNLFDKNP